MSLIYLPDLRLNASICGPEGAPSLVLIHNLGLDMQIWDGVVQRLPQLRILRFDLRGHGGSDTPLGPYAMGALIRDAERLIGHFNLRDCVVVGAGLGGLIAQGLAVKRLDLVRGLVLSNTAARIGFARQWQERIALVQEQGLAALADVTMERWFGRNWRLSAVMPHSRAQFLAGRAEGWAGSASAIAGTDFYETTAGLRLPTLVLAGANDGATPPDLVRETAELIPGSRFQLIQAAGHLPMLEQPAVYTDLLQDFLTAIGQSPAAMPDWH